MSILQIFSPGNDKIYRQWRERKLADCACVSGSEIVSVRNLSHVTQDEVYALGIQCSTHNFAIYKVVDPVDDDSVEALHQLRADLLAFCLRFGLTNTEAHRSRGADGVVAIEVNNAGVGAGYIPYSDKALSWHTDGYYNDEKNRIKAMVLHCVRDASEGGVNELLDPEIVYIRLRDADPELAFAMMHEAAMTIPENTDKRSDYRPASIGPVFFVDSQSGALSMRYSARTRNIIWRENEATDKARAMIADLLRNDPTIVRHKLQPGEGVISNNVLHNRTKFRDFDSGADGAEANQNRLLYRIRYKERIKADQM